jgi:hypothetical protein
MKFFEGKKIILTITPDVELYKCFEDNLKAIGFRVFTISYYRKFKYKNLTDQFVNILKKIFFNDKLYKKKLVKIHNNEEIKKLISKTSEADYSLTIRADLFDVESLKKIIKLGRENYAYQWDGLSRFPEVKKLITLFDKFYVFDEKDLIINNKTHLATNFYFDCYQTLFNKKDIEYDFYTLCNYDKRINKIISIYEILNEKGYKLKLILYSKPKKHLKKYSYITFIQEPISYYENLKNVANSKNLIDIQNSSIHNGLSFRVFEALGYNKKLITTNSNILNYDFYNKNNILYLDNNFNGASFEKFLNAPFEEIESSIKEKYSFTSWINYILNI